jgi:hypothetical protein
MIKICQSLSELSDSVSYLNINCGGGNYPTEFQTYEEGWDSLFLSFDHLRKKLGEARYAQLVDMAKQAKAHYDAGYACGDYDDPKNPGFIEINHGSWLMQDVGQVVRGKPPHAYPKDMYRWSK